MRRLKSNARLIFLSLLCGLVYFVIHYREQFIGLEHFDEGINLFGAVNLLEGKLPYKDFYSLYPPGFTIFIASVFKLFGITLFNARLATLILCSLSVVLACIFSIQTGSLIFGIVASLMITIYHTDIQKGSITVIVLGYILLYSFFKTRNRKHLFLAGLICGLSSFLRLDFAVYSFLASVATLYIRSWLQGKAMNRFGQSSFHRGINIFITCDLIMYGFGISVGVFPLLYFTYKANWMTSFQYLIIYARDISSNRSLPFPVLIPDIIFYLKNIGAISFRGYFQRIIYSWPFYFPYIVCMLVATDLVVRRKRLLKNQPEIFYTRILLTISIILSSFYMRVRADVEHTWPIQFLTFILFPSSLEGLFYLLKKYIQLIYLYVPSIVFLGMVLWSDYYLSLLQKYVLLLLVLILIFVVISKQKHLQIKEIVPASIVVLFFILNLLLLDYLRIYRSSQENIKDLILFDVPRAGNILVSKTKEGQYLKLVKYLLEVNKDRNPIFSGSTKHDIIFINDNLIYFLTGASSPTKYWQYDPGIQSSKLVQEDMIVELGQAKPKYTVLWALASVSNEPNLSSQSSGVHLLDNYIKNVYLPVKQYGNYIILIRKSYF